MKVPWGIIVMIITAAALMIAPRETRAQRAEDNTLVLPQAWIPTRTAPLPPAPQPLEAPKLPSEFIGCWKGDPVSFDKVYNLNPASFQMGEPGEIEFCYYHDQITIPEAQVRISAAKRLLDFALSLGLSFHTFSAHSTRTDIYSISSGEIRARTLLEIEETGHLLLLIPYRASSQSSIVDWDTKLAAPDLCVVNALQLITWGGQPLFTATWHASFHRSQAQ